MAFFVAVLGAMSCPSDAVARPRDEVPASLEGVWEGKLCHKGGASCGSFSVVLVQRGRAVCGTHASATRDLSKIDEGDPGSLTGTVKGKAAVVIITSGRNGASYIASVRFNLNRADWVIVGPVSPSTSGDSDLIPRTTTLNRFDTPDSREQVASLKNECKWRSTVSVDEPAITPSDSERPDYLLANAVRGNIEKLHSSEGIALSDDQVSRLTAGLLVEVKQAGMTRVDEVMFGRMPGGEIHPSIHAYQVHDGKLDHPYTARASVFGPDAVNIPIEQSYQRLQEVTQQLDHQQQQDHVLQQNEAQQQTQGMAHSRTL
jgi:hypothetical protein